MRKTKNHDYGKEILYANIIGILIIILIMSLFLYNQNIYGKTAGLPGSPISNYYVHGSFETAGVIITLAAGHNSGNEKATLEIKGPEDADFHEVHPFTKYDGSNMATSIFNLEPGTTYELRITLHDPGYEPYELLTEVITREEFVIPEPLNTIVVSNLNDLNTAIREAEPGDEIKVSPGRYTGRVMVREKAGTEEHPIVIRAADPDNKPIISSEGFRPIKSSYIVIDGFEITDGLSNNVGVRIEESSNIVVQNLYIHDYGKWGIYVAGSQRFPGGINKGGYHLIQDNVVESSIFIDNSRGIELAPQPGAGIVIRRNTIKNADDNVRICNDPESAGNIRENTPHALALTGGGEWTNHNLDFYDNTIIEAGDDHMEADGVCINARIFRNTFKGHSNGNILSFAPGIPGPFFFIYNTIEATWEQSVIKFNTNNAGGVPTRNIFFYHNDFTKAERRGIKDSVINLWYGFPGEHITPVKNILFRNNIFWAKDGGRMVGSKNRGEEHPSFDYNLWYTPTMLDETDPTYPMLFGWYPGGEKDRFVTTFEEFHALSGQERNGIFAEPMLDGSLIPMENSPLIDEGVVIPGINDGYSSTAPDIGVIETEFIAEVPACTDNDRDGYSTEGRKCGVMDCNDDNSIINPGADEICETETNENCAIIDIECAQCNDGIDNDGDSLIDMEDSNCRDADDNDEASGDRDGEPVLTCLGDVNEDEEIDIFDLVIVANKFGKRCR